MNFRGVKREVVLVSVGSLLFSLLFNHALLRHMGQIPVANDWDQHMHWYWVAAETITRFHQFPLWNPYGCGGTPLLGNPQSHVLTPTFLFQLIFGANIGFKLEMIVQVAMAVAGGYLLARVLGISPWASIPCAVIFPWSSALYLHLSEGHGWSLTYCFVPGVLAGTWYSAKHHNMLPAALGGMGLAFMIDGGGIYPAPHLILLLCFLMTLEAVHALSLWPLVALAVTGVFSVLFSAAKLLPVYELMKFHPRLIESTERNGLHVMYEALFGHNQAKDRGDLQLDWGFHEYGAYIGWVAAGLALIGILLTLRRNWPWLASVILFAALGTGDYLSIVTHWPGPKTRTSLSPWYYLHKYPLFSSQHVPSRFWVTLVILVGVFASFGVDELVKRAGRAGTLVLVACLLLTTYGAADALKRGPWNLKHMFDDPVAVLPQSKVFQQVWDDASNGSHPLDMYARAVANLGAINCYDDSHLDTGARARNRPHYLGEEYFPANNGRVQLVKWTPEELTYEVDVLRPGVLAINQNYDPAWHLASGAGEVVDSSGVIGVSLPAGHQQLILKYYSRPFAIGLSLLLLGCWLIVLLAMPMIAPGLWRWVSVGLMALVTLWLSFTIIPSFVKTRPKPVSADKPCAPFGDPLPTEGLTNTDPAFICSRGNVHPEDGRGESVELYVACKPGTHRSGWHWHIWCLADGTGCSANYDSFLNDNESNWNVGQHCTEEGFAMPGNHSTKAW